MKADITIDRTVSMKGKSTVEVKLSDRPSLPQKTIARPQTIVSKSKQQFYNFYKIHET